MTSSPLVSIIVITYNSAKFVLETLESAKNQTYKNIELIISDDGSTDETIKICEGWLEENKNRFLRTKLITVPKNTGIPANCNRGVKEALGEWIKFIAGDDVFIEDGIENFIKNANSEYKVIQTNVEIYKDGFQKENLLGLFVNKKPSKFFHLSAKKQFELLKYHTYMSTPAIFFHNHIFKNLSFDEDFKLIEDYPFFLLLTKNNYQISYLNVLTVKYRIHEMSVQKQSLNLYENEKIKNNIRIEIKTKYFKRKYNSFNKFYDHLKVFSHKNPFFNKLISLFDNTSKKIIPYL